jgi:pyroglutamyl-peptidase
MNYRTSILLTGFAPFPTQPVNATAALAPMIAAIARRAFPDVRVRVEILPTEWRAGPWRMEDCLLSETPDAAIFFGIASRAKGFEIETRGKNARGGSADAVGFEPPSGPIVEHAPKHLPATLPTSDILRRLRARGIPAIPSRNAGVYLCNAVLYQALSMARNFPGLKSVGFVHLPSELGIPGRRQTEVNRSCPITWDEAVIGGVEIVGACIGRAVPVHALALDLSRPRHAQ